MPWPTRTVAPHASQQTGPSLEPAGEELAEPAKSFIGLEGPHLGVMGADSADDDNSLTL